MPIINLKSFFKKNIIVVFLVLLVIILIFLKVISSSSNNQLIDDIPTPTTAPVKISESEINEEDSIVDQEVIDKSVEKSQNDYPLWSKLPYVQENFKISHYIKPMVLLVKIKDESVKNGAVETEINKWLEENGFGKESHQMEWQTVESF